MTSEKINRLLIITLIVTIILLVLLLVIKITREQPRPADAVQSPMVTNAATQWTEALKHSTFDTGLNASALSPYVEYGSISLILDTVPTMEVRDFLIQYRDTPLADKMRKQWLTVLANKQNWSLFLEFYQPYPDPEFKCFYATALLKTGQITQAYDMADTLWMVPYSQSPACDFLFTAWTSNQPLSTEKILRRFDLALKAGNIDVAKYVVTLLPEQVKPRAMLWLEVWALPTLILDPSYFKNDDDTLNDVIVYGLQRMAYNNANDAVMAWSKLRKTHHFTAEQVQLVIQAIAISYIKGDSSQADIWLQQLDSAYLDNTTKQWRLLFTLQEQNWPLLIQWIEQLPIKERDASQWQYWYARALEQTGQPVAARKIYGKLAAKPDYYGFLATYHLNRSIVIKSQSLPITYEEARQFLAIPGIQRMEALYAINQRKLGNAEWWFAINRMTQKQRYIAAKVAQEWKLYSLSLATTGYLSDQSDTRLVYSTPFEAEVQKAAVSFHIDPAFVYAIIRQESLFNPQAVSYVGAQGLMQLMPATASMLAQQNGLSTSDAQNLTDPAINIQLGSAYLSHLLATNNGNPALAAAAYNAGPGRIKKWLPHQGSVDFDIWVDSIPYPETRTYVKNVLMYLIIYQGLLNKEILLGDMVRPITSQ